jgi:fructose-1,6-bisphosphatase I
MLYDYLIEKGAGRELAELLLELSRAIEEISAVIVHTETGKAGTQNSYGEEQLAMDKRADDIMARYLGGSPYVAAYCSEELDSLQTANPDGIFSVFHDPLDGSSLFDVNLSVGTIIGVYKGADVMGRTPREQVAALYALYGPKTTLVVSVGAGVHEFLLTEGGWKLESESLRLSGDAKAKKYFAPGNLRATLEREDYFKLVTEMMREQYTLRYSGGMVPDVNHILKKGSGVFMYPGMPSAPQGKLRLLYECGPLAYLIEQAGGASSDGECECAGGCGGGGACARAQGCQARSVLDVKITSLTQKTPVFLGGEVEVRRVVEALSKIEGQY